MKAFWCALLAVVALASDARADVLTLKLAPATRYSLANGLRVVLQEDHRLPRVAVHVAYRVGSADDRPGYAGLAHLVEHLTFRGSRHVPAPGVLALFERLGATELQGTTGLLQTDYWAVVPAQQLENALWIESDRMAFSLEKIDRKNLDRERAIVSQELRLKFSASARTDHVWRALFPEGHPFRPPPSELEDLKHFELRHVQRFMQEHYRPDNATLVVVGDFDSARAQALIARYFGPIVAARVPLARRPARAVALSGLKRLLIVTPDRQERMDFAWLSPAIAALERKRLAIALDVLAGRVRRRLVVAEGLSSGVTAGTSALGPVQLSALTVYLSARSDAYRVEEAVRAELERLHREGPGKAEVAENRAFGVADVIFGLEHLQRRAAGLAEDPPIEPSVELRELRAIDERAVLAAARSHLSSGDRLVAYSKWDKEAPRGGEVVNEQVTTQEEAP